MVLFRGCMVLFGGVRGFIRGHGWFYLGGMHGFWGGVHGFSGGSVCGFFSFFGYNEIRSMSGAVRILLECILVKFALVLL